MNNDCPKIERLLKLIVLLSGKKEYSVNELAEVLETSYRSVYRYVQSLKNAGFVIVKKGRTLQLAKNSRRIMGFENLINFSEEEAYIINRLIESLDETNVLKQNLKKKLASVYDSIAKTDSVVRYKNTENVSELSFAIREKRQVILKNYSSSNSGRIRDRLVEPFEFLPNFISLWCFDVESKTNKLFKVERIEDVKVLATGWKYEIFHEVGLVDVFRMAGSRREKIGCHLSTRAKNLLIEEYPLSEPFIRQESENKWVFETEICDFRPIIRFAVGLGGDVSIDYPRELSSRISKFISDNLKEYINEKSIGS